MSQSELLSLLARKLNEAQIPYMITGSIASSIYGEPRLTHDIDVIVEIIEKDLERIAGLFPEEQFYFDADAARVAIRTRDMFNVVDLNEGDKIDFWLVTDSDFDRSRFSRRASINIFDTELFVSSPEDLIIMKLLWSRKAGGSEKQVHDARSIYEVQREKLDEHYLAEWAERLGLVGELRTITD